MDLHGGQIEWSERRCLETDSLIVELTYTEIDGTKRNIRCRIDDCNQEFELFYMTAQNVMLKELEVDLLNNPPRRTQQNLYADWNLLPDWWFDYRPIYETENQNKINWRKEGF